MASPSLVFFAFLPSLLLCTRSMATAMASSDKNPTSYIHASCSRTLYPGLCCASLCPFAGRVGSDPVLLARFAMNVTASRLKPLSARIALRQASPGPGVAGSEMKDCRGLISDATDLVKKSEKELTGLEGLTGPEVSWRIANAQTWLSAAITDEGTCSDECGNGGGGEGEGEGEEVEVVRKKVKRAQQLTSIALALVNCLVNN